MIRVRLDLETLSRTSSHDSEDQTDLRLYVSQELAQYHSTLSRSVDQNVQKVDQRISKIEELLMTQAMGVDKSQFPTNMPEAQSNAVAMRRRPRGVISSPDAEKMALESQAVGVRVRRYALSS